MNNFQISSIKYGWFEIGFAPYRNGYCLLNSMYLGCDAPKLLLSSLSDLTEKKTEDEWLCWQDEPGAEILHMYYSEEKIFIEVYQTHEDSLDLSFSGEDLKKIISKCVYKKDFEFTGFIDDVIASFSLYENGNGLRLYNTHWGEFPQSDFDRLKKYAREINKMTDKYHKMFCLTY